MNYFLSFLLILFLNCDSQSIKAPSDDIPFEEVHHFSYQLISQNSQLLDNQDKIESVYKVIHSKTEGNRLAPIPTLMPNETYLVFRPILKNSNDVEIKSVLMKNNALHIKVAEFNNPEMEKQSRHSPSILIKISKKIKPTNIIIEY